MIKPHSIFEVYRADEVAEMWDGVDRNLYRSLWNKVVPEQKEILNLEDSGPMDHVGFESLASHWNKFTEEEQRELNRLAENRDYSND